MRRRRRKRTSIIAASEHRVSSSTLSASTGTNGDATPRQVLQFPRDLTIYTGIRSSHPPPTSSPAAAAVVDDAADAVAIGAVGDATEYVWTEMR